MRTIFVNYVSKQTNRQRRRKDQEISRKQQIRKNLLLENVQHTSVVFLNWWVSELF